jgi:hypothetical protein
MECRSKTTGMTDYPLYDEGESVPKRVCTPSQQETLARTRHNRLAARRRRQEALSDGELHYRRTMVWH